MNGSAVLRTATSSLGPEWTLVGVGDLNGDGTADLLLRNSATATLVIRFMSGGVVQGSAVFGVGNDWDVTGLGDVNGDGRADVVWRQPASGVCGFWFMNGGSILRMAVFGAGTGWTVAGVGDLNGDGNADVLWRQPATGLIGIWFMDGATVVKKTSFGVGTGWDPDRRLSDSRWQPTRRSQALNWTDRPNAGRRDASRRARCPARANACLKRCCLSSATRPWHRCRAARAGRSGRRRPRSMTPRMCPRGTGLAGVQGDNRTGGVAPFKSHALSRPPLDCCHTRSGFVSPLISPAPTIFQSLPDTLAGSPTRCRCRFTPFIYQTATAP